MTEQQVKQESLIDKRRRLAAAGLDLQTVDAAIITAWGRDGKRLLDANLSSAS